MKRNLLYEEGRRLRSCICLVSLLRKNENNLFSFKNENAVFILILGSLDSCNFTEIKEDLSI